MIKKVQLKPYVKPMMSVWMLNSEYHLLAGSPPFSPESQIVDPTEESGEIEDEPEEG